MREVNAFVEAKPSRLITNRNTKFLSCLENEFEECEEFKFVIAFVRMSGIQLIIDKVQKMSQRGVKGEIITSNYLFSTQPQALYKLMNIPNVTVKIVDVTSFSMGLHAKSYYFINKESVSLYVGSNNLTKSGLKENTEWSLHTYISKYDEIAIQFLEEFKILNLLPEICIETYSAEYEVNRHRQEIEANYQKEYLELLKTTTGEFSAEVKQNAMQVSALKNLYDFRKKGLKKAIAIAATGTGKTYLSAFDAKAFNPKRLLFIVHNKEIANGAISTYKNIFGSEKTYGLVGDGSYEIDKDFVFALPQTLKNNLSTFKNDMFDYIVFDEAHRIAGDVQQEILKHFRPQFLFGMTATPDRMDGKDIYTYFDDNIATDVRLKEALNQGYLTPFHYFGIADDVDYNDEDVNDLSKLSKKLSVNRRVDFIIENMEKFGYAGDTKRRCLGFCVTKEHAHYMSEEFKKRGYRAKALTGENKTEDRKESIGQLMSERDELEFIFTVDIFNEGVDIPSVNLILMLRPTNSATIFIQQLGRGLRKTANKEFLTVLDFIGNHSNNYVMSYALNDGNIYDPSSMKTVIKSGHWGFIDDVHISLDEVSKERIFKSIGKIDFSKKSQLKSIYNNFRQDTINIRKKKIFLMDYFLANAAPDPLKFTWNKLKNYYNFVNDIEGELIFNISNELEEVLNYLMTIVPLRRPIELQILKHLLNNEMMKKDLKERVLRDSTFTEMDFESALQFLCRVGFSDIEKESLGLKKNIVDINSQNIKLNINFIRADDKEIFIDFLEYTLNRYREEINIQTERLVLYQTYAYSTVALVLNSNLKRSINSWREGVCKMDNDFQIFINLHKQENIEDSIRYNDQFLDQSTLIWDSQNITTQTSNRGVEMISYVNDYTRGWDIFIRKSSNKLYGEIPRFIYLGKGVPIEYSGNKPINFKIKLLNQVPLEIYEELTI